MFLMLNLTTYTQFISIVKEIKPRQYWKSLLDKTELPDLLSFSHSNHDLLPKEEHEPASSHFSQELVGDWNQWQCILICVTALTVTAEFYSVSNLAIPEAQTTKGTAEGSLHLKLKQTMLHCFVLWLLFFIYSFIQKEKGKSPFKSLSSLILGHYLIFWNVILTAGHVG